MDQRPAVMDQDVVWTVMDVTLQQWEYVPAVNVAVLGHVTSNDVRKRGK